MKRDLLQVSAADVVDGEDIIEYAGRRNRVQRVLDRASHRLASRRVSLLAEQQMEREWFWRSVRLEVDRARRRNVEFSMLCIRGLDAETLIDVADHVRTLLRGTDAVTTERDRVLILLSDTSSNDAMFVTSRIAEHVQVLREPAYWKEVAFPRDALTLRALIECLMADEVGERLLLAG